MLSCAVFSQEYWVRVPSPVTGFFTRCMFADSTNGWACGEGGMMIRSTNGGDSWESINTGLTSYVIEDVFFFNSRLGWFAANDGGYTATRIGKTTNGGVNWTVTPFQDSASINWCISFSDSLTGFLSGYSGKIFKTTDGGLSWSTALIDPAGCPPLYNFPKNRIRFMNSLTGFACGGVYDIQGIVWKTTDAGNNWHTYCVAPEPFFDIKPVSLNRVIAGGGDFEFGASTAVSVNGGPWIYDTTGLFGVGRDLAFRTASEVWMPLSFAQSWAVNLDSGSAETRWYGIPGTDSTVINAAAFFSPTKGFGFGSNGAIVKYNTSVIGVSPHGTVPTQNRLGQNYPNPFNPATVISFDLEMNTPVKITLFDLTGRSIGIVFSGYRQAGHHSIRFDGSRLASGVYIYRLEAGRYIAAKKMVILK